MEGLHLVFTKHLGMEFVNKRVVKTSVTDYDEQLTNTSSAGQKINSVKVANQIKGNFWMYKLN